ncbi:hypothetical protein [Chlamydia vaughanii]|uniref:hypothetical protein n=1 Tax=Chlamydia vaughanii TaxID=3112552 RepID=UPI0032B15C62
MATQSSQVSQVAELNSAPVPVNTRLALFSELGIPDQGSTVSSWKTRCQLASCIGLFCLGVLAILAGSLILSFLSVTLWVGVAFIALGSLLIMTSVLLYLSTRPDRVESKEKQPPVRVDVRDLQEQLRSLLMSTDAYNFASRDCRTLENPRETLEAREALLAKFDRDLRIKEGGLYRLLSQEGENRHALVRDLSEFREMQSRLSDELELLYRSYELFAGRGETEGHNGRLVRLQESRDLIVQEILDIRTQRAHIEENLLSLNEAATALTEKITPLEQKIAEENSAGQPKEGLERARLVLLEERNTLFSRISVTLDSLHELAQRENAAMQQRSAADYEVYSLLDLEEVNVTYNYEYRKKYLRLAGAVSELRTGLIAKEASLLAYAQEIENLNETIESLHARTGSLAASSEEAERYQHIIRECETHIQDLTTKMNGYRGLLREAEECKQRLLEQLRNLGQDNLQREALENKTALLEVKIANLEEDIQRRINEERRLKAEIASLQAVILSSESAEDNTEQLDALRNRIRDLTISLEDITRERTELADTIAAKNIQLHEAQEKNASLTRILLDRDEKLAASEKEIARLNSVLTVSEENVSSLSGVVYERREFEELRQQLLRSIQILEQDKVNLNFRMIAAVEESRAAVAQLQQVEEEKAQLTIEIQNLKKRYQEEKTRLEAERIRLEGVLEARHLEHTEETARLRTLQEQLRAQLGDSYRLAESSQEGAIDMLASNLIMLSPHVKETKKPEVRGMEFEEMLAFTAPRFFGFLGSGISCRYLRPGVYLEEDVAPDASDEEKRRVIKERCLREWLHALLGCFTLDQIKEIFTQTRTIGLGYPDERSDQLFERLGELHPGLLEARELLNDWLRNSYPYITQLQVFTTPGSWNSFLFKLLQSMHEKSGGAFENFQDEEWNYLEILSTFSGQLPLVLGSIGRSEGTTPGSGNPLGDFNYDKLGNLSWQRLIQVVREIMRVRAGLNGPLVLGVNDIAECALRTTTIEAYAASMASRHRRATWKSPDNV